MKIAAPLAFVLRLLLAPTTAVFAQEQQPDADTLTVQGTVVNGTDDRPVPAGLALMLHGWGPDGAPLEMLHGETLPGGRFEFENVLLEPDVYYAAMVVYQEVAYFSGEIELGADGESAPVELRVFETTDQIDAVRIDQLHVILGFAQGGLMVAEVYVLSNPSDFTVRNAAMLGDGTGATMLFSLPAEAANVSFPTGPGGRFVLEGEGFADTQPLVPSERAGEVVVSYILSYEDGLQLTHSVPLEVGQVTVFIPHGSEIGLGQEAEYLGVRTFGDGEALEAYSLGGLGRGDPLELEVEGSLPEAVRQAAPKPPGPDSDQGTAIGLAALGLALAVAGAWWFRRVRLGDADLDLAEETAPTTAMPPDR